MYRIDEQGEVHDMEEGQWMRQLWDWHDVKECWNYEEGDMAVVELYTNCPQAELILNGESLGEKKLADFRDHVMKWGVPFAPGTLKAKATAEDGTVVEHVLATGGDPVAMGIKVDRKDLLADHYDVAHIEVQLTDRDGNPVRHADREIVFSVDGKLRIIGVDNGSKFNVQPYQSDRLVTDRGRAMLVVQSKGQEGKADIRIEGEGISPETITLMVMSHK